MGEHVPLPPKRHPEDGSEPGLNTDADTEQNNWNSLGCDVSEDLLLDTSKKLIQLGLRDVGYNYVVLDDCWSNGRDENGFLKVNERKFPSGMKHISDEIHDMGMLYGMYSSAGEYTCARFGGELSLRPT